MVKQVQRPAIRNVEMLLPGMYVSFLHEMTEIVDLIDTIENDTIVCGSHKIKKSQIISIGSINGTHRIKNFNGNFYKL